MVFLAPDAASGICIHLSLLKVRLYLLQHTLTSGRGQRPNRPRGLVRSSGSCQKLPLFLCVCVCVSYSTHQDASETWWIKYHTSSDMIYKHSLLWPDLRHVYRSQFLGIWSELITVCVPVFRKQSEPLPGMSLYVCVRHISTIRDVLQEDFDLL